MAGNARIRIDRGDPIMKRITALLHPNRIGEVVHALAAAGHRRFSVVHGQGLLQALSAREQTYSVELGELITQQIQLDVYCVDDELPIVVGLIQRNGRTGQTTSGWLFVSSIDHAYAIDGN
jgi:nitrogen regulatory protein P-II 1